MMKIILCCIVKINLNMRENFITVYAIENLDYNNIINYD
jgi:hypothetical protein